MHVETRDGVNFALKIIGSAGLDGILVPANTPKDALNKLLAKASAKSADQTRILTELRRQRLIEIKKTEGGICFILSLAGAYRLEKLIVEELEIPKPKKWDGFWRAVTFDVPLEHSRERAAFTSQLQRLGFYMIQKSFWVYPYPCFEQLEQLGGYYNVLRYCTLFEVNSFDKISEKRLLNHFGN